MNKFLKYVSYGFVVFIAWYIVFGVSTEKKERVLATTNAFLSCPLPKNTKVVNFSFGRATFLYAVDFQIPNFSFAEYESSLKKAGWKRIDIKGDGSEGYSYQRGDCVNTIRVLDKSSGKWQEFIIQETKK